MISKGISKCILTASVYMALGITLCALGGCSINAPKVRLGSLPTATFGVPFADPNDLGNHSYFINPFEKGGIVYTCKAGHVDIDHVRGCADATKYFINRVRKTLLKGKSGFSFNMTLEMSTHKIDFIYPENWDSMVWDRKEAIADEIAFEVGPYFAYTATVWHEILTWFGVHFGGFEPEFNSAFSWEDVYSNLVGTRLAVEALKDPAMSYNDAMTVGIDRELRKLYVQPKSKAIWASDKMRGKWYTGNLVPDTKKRNFDIGLDGSVTPTLIPDVPGCSDEPVSYPVPTTDVLKKYGFMLRYEIKPNVFEQGKIFAAAAEDWIYPEVHFPIIMDYIRKEAAARGYDYDQ
ncbi:MAG: DUF4056 domain-containing protein [Planctomycetota bacterium]|jgi:hypothetical protein